MKKQVEITYEWWRNDVLDYIPELHREELEKHALDRINSQMKEGFTCGELNESIRFGREVVPEEDEEGIEYRGSWSINTKTL